MSSKTLVRAMLLPSIYVSAHGYILPAVPGPTRPPVCVYTPYQASIIICLPLFDKQYISALTTPPTETRTVESSIY